MRCPKVITAVFFLAAISFTTMAGIANSDPGGVPGQIAAVQAQVTTLQGQVAGLQGNDAALASAIAALQSNTASLTAMVAALQTSNATLIAEIAALQITTGGGPGPGPVSWTYFETSEPFTLCSTTSADPDGCNVGGAGDNVIRLINPNGSPNGNLGAGKEHTVCAMVYAFDDDEEMGECCGCPLSSVQLATFSVKQNLTANWALVGGPEGGDHGNGSIAIVAAAPNALSTCAGGGPGCHGGCDPSNEPGYSVTGGNGLLGTVTHNQQVQADGAGGGGITTGLTEVGLSDDGGGDVTNLVYLQAECGAIIGNGSGGGICNCPIE